MNIQLPLFKGVTVDAGGDELCVSLCNVDAISRVSRWFREPKRELWIIGEEASGKSSCLRCAERFIKGSVAVDPLSSGEVFQLSDVSVILYDAGNDVVPDEAGLHHCRNYAAERGIPMLGAMRPDVFETLRLPDLRSRMAGVETVHLPPPDDELLRQLISKAFLRRQLIVPDGVVSYLTPRIERAYSAPFHIAARLDLLALERKRPVTIALVKDVLAEQ